MSVDIFTVESPDSWEIYTTQRATQGLARLGVLAVEACPHILDSYWGVVSDNPSPNRLLLAYSNSPDGRDKLPQCLPVNEALQPDVVDPDFDWELTLKRPFVPIEIIVELALANPPLQQSVNRAVIEGMDRAAARIRKRSAPDLPDPEAAVTDDIANTRMRISRLAAFSLRLPKPAAGVSDRMNRAVRGETPPIEFRYGVPLSWG